MNFSQLSTACAHGAGKILSAAALLLAFGTTAETSAQLQSPVQVGPGAPPNTIPAGTLPTAPTMGIPYTDPILPQLWLWNTATPTMPTIRLQNASALPSTPPGGSLWGLARPSQRLSSLACNSGTDPDVVFKADGDTKDLIITNLGTRSGGIRFATTIAPVGASPNYTEKERVTIMNNGNVMITPDAGGKLHVNGRVHLTSSLMPNGSPGSAGQVLTSQGMGVAPTWTTLTTSIPAVDIAWLTGGNNNTDETNFLGTTIEQPLILKTDNTERMRVTKEGWVGIGTSDPARHFEVKGWGQVVGQFTSEARTTLDILSTANTGAGYNEGNAQIRFLNEYPGGTGSPVLHGSWMAGMDAEDNYKFKIAPLNDSRWLGASTFVINPDGKIGIGTNDPKDNLHVWGTVRIGEKGVVGDHSDYKLAVDGKIAARSIVCRGAIDWADFVFDESYDLPSLEEVAESIRINKHLPGIPSAAQVQEEGVDIVSMQSKLLQKVEELTLYMIELKVENKRLQQEVSTLKQNVSNK